LAKEGIVCGYCGKTIGEGEACPNTDKVDEMISAMPEIGKKA
jgi:hypothetical protein